MTGSVRVSITHRIKSTPRARLCAGIDLGLCLDLKSASGIEWVRASHESLVDLARAARFELPTNSPDLLRRNLDCAVIKRLHEILNERRLPPVDTVKGIFTEGAPVYPNAGFREKTHVQIAVRNLQCIKGVFRVTPARRPRRRS